MFYKYNVQCKMYCMSVKYSPLSGLADIQKQKI